MTHSRRRSHSPSPFKPNSDVSSPVRPPKPVERLAVPEEREVIHPIPSMHFPAMVPLVSVSPAPAVPPLVQSTVHVPDSAPFPRLVDPRKLKPCHIVPLKAAPPSIASPISAIIVDSPDALSAAVSSNEDSPQLFSAVVREDVNSPARAPSLPSLLLL
jgi:hypothetical protein